ncbi:MAG: type III CRISPR-associated RAMP protein Csx7 [Thermoprotei archaeon]|jgi:CRISPR-associated RAMP protein (TIGR02581 family)
MQDWVSFDTLYREVVLNIEYTNLSPLRIGAGTAKLPTSPIDLQVITIVKNGVHVPYIPGSSLKGVLRTVSENIVNSLNLHGYKCFMGDGCKSRYDEVLKDYLKRNLLDDVKKLLQNYCPVCKVFGSASFSAHIHVNDAYPVSSSVGRGVKVGIAIDRRSGAAKKGAFYTVEYVEPGVVFHGSLVFKNTPNYLIGLVVNALDMINSGYISIGGFKTRGFGKIKVDYKGIDGVSLQNNRYLRINEIKELSGLDEYDSPVLLDSVERFLSGVKEAWGRYVEKKYSGKS